MYVVAVENPLTTTRAIGFARPVARAVRISSTTYARPITAHRPVARAMRGVSTSWARPTIGAIGPGIAIVVATAATADGVMCIIAGIFCRTAPTNATIADPALRRAVGARRATCRAFESSDPRPRIDSRSSGQARRKQSRRATDVFGQVFAVKQLTFLVFTVELFTFLVKAAVFAVEPLTLLG